MLSQFLLSELNTSRQFINTIGIKLISSSYQINPIKRRARQISNTAKFKKSRPKLVEWQAFEKSESKRQM